MKENSMEKFKNWSNPSEMVTLFEYYGKAQGMVVGRKVYETAIEDRVETEMKPTGNTKYPMVRAYPRTWLDKLDYIDQVHENGAVSDKDIINKLVTEYEKDGENKEA